MKNRFFSLTFAVTMVLVFSSCDKNESKETKTATFEDLALPASNYWDGSDGSGHFTSADLSFDNFYEQSYGSWSGFAYSNLHDVETEGFGNQYSVFDSSNGANRFAIFYLPYQEQAYMSFAEGQEGTIESMTVCNSTFAGLSMKNGDAYSKKFGGVSGNDPDWFKITIDGYNLSGVKIGSVEFYLSDYQSSDNSKDYIVNKWTKVNLSSLGKVHKISFNLTSTDSGDWGINTPAYFCLDNIRYTLDEINL